MKKPSAKDMPPSGAHARIVWTAGIGGRQCQIVFRESLNLGFLYSPQHRDTLSFALWSELDDIAPDVQDGHGGTTWSGV